MTTIQSTSITGVSVTDQQTAIKQAQQAQSDSFDALISMLTQNTNSSSSNSSSTGSQNNDLLGNIFSALYGLDSSSSSTDTSSSDAAAFGLSPSFESTFGSSGPLVDYINSVTQGLGLNSTQNAALQNIAVENKDTTGSATDIQTMENELIAAGLPG